MIDITTAVAGAAFIGLLWLAWAQEVIEYRDWRMSLSEFIVKFFVTCILIYVFLYHF